MANLADSAAARAYAVQVARHRRWVVNPDTALTQPIFEGLVTQNRRFGKPFCPCRDTDGGPTDQDIVCPCAYAQADIDETGQCYCGLYLGVGKDPNTVTSIPERRP